MITKSLKIALVSLFVAEGTAGIVGLRPNTSHLRQRVADARQQKAESDRLREDIIATGPGCDGVDFVSRLFCPNCGVPEDPGTGSSHCTLVPYWAERLGKTTLHARQISARGGDLLCELAGDRVKIAGQAALYRRGEIEVC